MKPFLPETGPPGRYAAELEDFRRLHSLEAFSFGATPVPYYDTGGDSAAVMVLHGASQNAEYAFRRILQLKDDFRVVAPTVNAFRSLDELGRGLSGLMDALGIERIHVLGGSFGGMVAQAFFRRHRARIDNLVLGFTAPPLPEYGRLFKAVRLLLNAVPEGILKKLTKKELLKMFISDPAWPAETRQLLEFYRTYFLYMLSSVMTKQDLMGQYRLAVEFNARESYRPENFADHRGRILIATSKDDPSFKYHERLKAQFPGPEELVFEGGGHVGALVHEDEYMRRVKTFLGGPE
jgi:pimeloyl-ACP methyl ester carboxylesterase